MIAHDARVAPAVVLAGVLVSRRLPRAWAAPIVVATVVWGSLTLLAVPVLGRFGAKDDNPTLLDRGYLTAWWVGTAVVVALVVVAGTVRRTSPGSDPPALRRVEPGSNICSSYCAQAPSRATVVHSAGAASGSVGGRP